MGILAGLIGWVITGALVSINLAGPAYRVTVPACVLVATLRLKQKAERERLEQAKRLAKQKAERERLEQAKRLAKQKAEREANKTKRTWYLAIIFLIDLTVLAVFLSKENTNQAMTQIIAQKAVLKNSKTLATRSHKN